MMTTSCRAMRHRLRRMRIGPRAISMMPCRCPSAALQLGGERPDQPVVVVEGAFVLAAAALGELQRGPPASSVVLLDGTPIHATSRSLPPGFSGATSAVISSVSVRFQRRQQRARPLQREGELAGGVVPGRGGRRRAEHPGGDRSDGGRELVAVEPAVVAPAAGREAHRALHVVAAGSPAGGGHARRRFQFGDEAGRARRIDDQAQHLPAAAQRVAVGGDAVERDLHVTAAQALDQIDERLALHLHRDRLRRHLREILRRLDEIVLGDLRLLELALVHVGIVRRRHRNDVAAERDPAVEGERLAGLLADQADRDGSLRLGALPAARSASRPRP